MIAFDAKIVPLTVEIVQRTYKVIWALDTHASRIIMMRQLKQDEAAHHVHEKWEKNAETGRYELVALVSVAGKSWDGE